MTAEDWKKVAAIYSETMDREPEERHSFITEACAGDPTLEVEVRRLVEASATAEGFLERPLSLIAGVLPTVGEFVPRLQSGDILCDRFEIVRFIAHGGMGEVYEAYDRVLHEPAAIKTVRPEIVRHPPVVEQFKQEVRRARAIRSDHVCPVFDVFTDNSGPDPLIFLSMQLLQGETLSARLRRQGPFSVSEAHGLLRDLADGLDAAHRLEIVHGDLKSGNIMLVRAKSGGLSAWITDFGLARQAEPSAATEETEAGIPPAAGTPEYMAPEQLRGAPPSQASDIYALGLIAFEMVTGRLPFAGETADERTLKRLDEEPRAPRSLVPSLPHEWDDAILRCLSRMPEPRYATAAEFIASLDAPWQRPGVRPFGLGLAIAALAALTSHANAPRAGASIQAPVNSLAVLAFQPLDAGTGSEYFADGFTEELTHTLARLRDLQVVGSESAMRFRESRLSPYQIGNRLGVRYLLSGKVRRAAGRFRVSAQLIQAHDSAAVWVEELDRNETQIAAAQNEIARRVAEKLHVSLAGMGSGATDTTSDLRAQDLYWMGRHYWRGRTDSDLRQSLELFEQATAQDPTFATAWAGLADAYALIGERNMIAPSEALEKASHAARTAVSLDPQLADAWVSMGQVVSMYDRNLGEAERCFRRALQLNARLGTALQWYSYLLAKQRRFDEAIGYARQAVEVEPFAYPANSNLAVILYYAREDDQAFQQCHKTAQLEPSMMVAHLMAAQILARRGRVGEAFSEMKQIREAAQAHPLVIRFWGEMYAILGRRLEAEEAIARLVALRPHGRVPASYIASVWGMLADRDKAFEWLETAFREYDGLVSIVHAAPGFDSIRADGRYPALLAKIGITAGAELGSDRPR